MPVEEDLAVGRGGADLAHLVPLLEQIGRGDRFLSDVSLKRTPGVERLEHQVLGRITAPAVGDLEVLLRLALAVQIVEARLSDRQLVVLIAREAEAVEHTIERKRARAAVR